MGNLIVGGDFGNGESTIVWRDGRGVQKETIPSYVGTGDYAGLEQLRGAVEAGGGGDEITLGGISSFVGALALEQSADATTARLSPSRYYDGHTLKLFLALAARRLPNDAKVRLFTGVPLHLLTDEMKARIRQMFCGTHVYSYRGDARRLVVEACAIGVEGGMVLHDHAHREVDQAVVDIGSGTTDPFWAKGRTPIKDRCVNYRAGVDKVGDLIRQSVQQRYDRDLEPRELDAVLRHYADPKHNAMPELWAGGRPLAINGIGDEAREQVGAELVRHLGRIWPADGKGKIARSAAVVRLIGGGAYFFRDQLAEAIPHLEVPKAPELQNALAYLTVGLAASEDAWRRNRGA